MQLSALLLGILALLLSLFLVLIPRATSPVTRFIQKLQASTSLHTTTMSNPASITTQTEWRKALEALPSTPNKIPAFFFAHGTPFLAFPEAEISSGAYGPMGAYHGPNGPLGTFLKDFGPALLKKYEPKGIVVFSAHWETSGVRQGM